MLRMGAIMSLAALVCFSLAVRFWWPLVIPGA
jgi:hypothetical protein